MPLIKSVSQARGSWAIWELTEDASWLERTCGEPAPAELTHPQKQLEWWAARILCRQLAESHQLSYSGTDRDENGRPGLKGHPSVHVSLSHSWPVVAAQLSFDEAAGIDVEQPRPQLMRVAARVFSEPELKDAGNNLVKLCVYWSAKEALYKVHGKRQLLFTDHLLVEPFSLADSGHLRGTIVDQNERKTIRLGYEAQNDRVVVYREL